MHQHLKMAIRGLVACLRALARAEIAFLSHALRLDPDDLTGLPRQRFLDRQLTQWLRRVDIGKIRSITVISFDLDDFKTYNEPSHAFGDALLKCFAQRLGSLIEGRGIVARSSHAGDEFVAIFKNLESKMAAMLAATELWSKLSEPFLVEGQEVDLTFSIGILWSTEGYKDLYGQTLRPCQVLTGRAAEARSLAKRFKFDRLAKDKVPHLVFYKDELFQRLKQEAERLRILGQAIRDRKFTVRYQPIVQLVDGKLCGLEALISIGEDSDSTIQDMAAIEKVRGWDSLIGPFLRQVHQDWLRLRTSLDREDLWMSVNLPPAILRNSAVLETLIEVIGDIIVSGIKPDQLILEVIERESAGASRRIIDRLDLLKRTGVKLALDDFGEGHSLGSKKAYPHFDLVKIVVPSHREIGETLGWSIQFFLACLEFLRRLGDYAIVVEGVETPEQVQWLQALTNPPKYAQGYYFGRGIVIEEAVRHLLLQRAD